MENLKRLYIGLSRGDNWYNYFQIESIKGGALAALDGADKTGASLLLNLIKASIASLYSEDGKELKLKENDYFDIFTVDGWKISREIMKVITKKDKPVFEEYFYCKVCSLPNMERYTRVEESWDKLIEDGFIDEIYADNFKDIYQEVKLPVGIEIKAGKTIQGGTFKKITRRPLTLGETIRLQKNSMAMSSEANMIFYGWDASIHSIAGMDQRDFNIFVKRNQSESFCKKYLVHQEDQEAMEEFDRNNRFGLIPDYRSVSCKHCHEEIGGYIDFTNFFYFLFPKAKSRSGKMSGIAG